MMRRFLAVLFALALAVASGQSLMAQAGAPAGPTLSLADALDYALQHYPAVRASLEQVSAARGGITLARTQYLPFLNGVYQDSRATQNQVAGICHHPNLAQLKSAQLVAQQTPIELAAARASEIQSRCALRGEPGNSCSFRLSRFPDPATAVGNDLERTFVIRVANNRVDWVDVKTGAKSGNLIEVFGDLKEGDQVAVRGSDQLRPGTEINPQLARAN